FRAADYTLLYSGGEGLSHTLIESLALGTPVIASDAGGNPEVVQHGMNGLLVPYVDPAALVRTLHEAFEPGRRAALAANTSAGLERFDWAHLVEQTIDVLRAAARRWDVHADGETRLRRAALPGRRRLGRGEREALAPLRRRTDAGGPRA